MALKKSVICIASIAFYAVLYAGSAQALPCGANVGNHLQATTQANAFLKPHQCLVSQNKKYVVAMRNDLGSLDLFRVVNPGDDILDEKSPIDRYWTSGETNEKDSGLIVHTTGALTIYRDAYGDGVVCDADKAKGCQGNPHKGEWSRGGVGTGNYFLMITDDGTLGLYTGLYGTDRAEHPIWHASLPETTSDSSSGKNADIWHGETQLPFPCITWFKTSPQFVRAKISLTTKVDDVLLNHAKGCVVTAVAATTVGALLTGGTAAWVSFVGSFKACVLTVSPNDLSDFLNMEVDTVCR